MMQGIPCVTTLTGAAASVSAIRALRDAGLDVRSLQDYHAAVATGKGIKTAAIRQHAVLPQPLAMSRLP